LNEYTGTAPDDGEVPDRPWAVYLAGPDNRFRLLAFDLDAKTPAADPDHDANVLAGHLTAAGIEHVICESGPGGGRHVWVALTEDRKSTRLNSSHVKISYAVFCLKKKTSTTQKGQQGACHQVGK